MLLLDKVKIFISKVERKAREKHDLPGKMDVKSVIPGESVMKAREKKETRRNVAPVK